MSTEHPYSPESFERRLASVRAELLPPLPAGRTSCRAGRYVHQSRRIQMRGASDPSQREEWIAGNENQTTTGRTNMSATMINLIIQIIAGALGGNAAGATMKNLDLGALGNTVAGAL